MTAPARFLPAASVAAALLFAATAAHGKQAKRPPGRTAVIDMAEVFAQYDKFEDVRENLQTEIKAGSADAEKIAANMEAIRKTLAAGTYKQDSEEYLNRAAQLNKLQTDLKVEQTKISQKFMKKEAELYKEIYADVTGAVKMFCEFKGYTMVIRYRRSTVDDADRPGDILQGMNRLVVYTAPEDDITDSIVGYLDRTYAKTSGKPVRDQKAEAAKQTAAASDAVRFESGVQR